MKKQIIFLLVLFSVLLLRNATSATIIVGRISHVDGQAYRYLDADQSWVETFVDSPAGTQDILAAGANSRVEINFPNDLQVQMDTNAEIEILNLQENAGEFFLQTGLARFYNQSAQVNMSIETARGTARLGPGASVDIQVDGRSVTVAAVYGETTFQSAGNGDLEVITGTTSLEFKEGSIFAGVSPINRSWDRWCLDRENLRSQNRVVRSEYLPETMQEYAYVLEPQGNWRRIYYRGHYYWAWQPRYVAAGWAPYTTGYWYDWQGDSVWIDYNPWGWVTHHHGHWIHTQGAWMWTPYVHVSFVPGVTVVGFNITFGKRYRPYWHPGRVRWIAHSSYVGWLPLAPWETYYGCRSWGPRSVRVRTGASFNINVNLAHHRYADHAVIIPKERFHKRGRAAINNYNKIRIKNVNKTVIARDYKPVSGAEEWRGRKQEVKNARIASPENRSWSQREKRAVKTREAARESKHSVKESAAIDGQRKESREKRDYRRQQPSAGENKGTVARRQELSQNGKGRNSVARAGQPNRVKQTVARQPETGAGKTERQNIIDTGKPLRHSKTVSTSQAKKESRQAVIRTDDRKKTGPANAATAARKAESVDQQEARKPTRVTQRQVEKNRQDLQKAPTGDKHVLSSKYVGKSRQSVAGPDKEKVRTPPSNTKRGADGDRLEGKQGAGRIFASGSLDRRSFRQ